MSNRTKGSRRPVLKLPFGGEPSLRQSVKRSAATLSGHEVRRIVAAMIG